MKMKSMAWRRGMLIAILAGAGMFFTDGRGADAAEVQEPAFAGQQEVLYRDCADEIEVIGGNILSVTYSSSDQRVAAVNQAGLVSGVDEGRTTISAEVQYDLGGEARTKKLSYDLQVIDNFTNYFQIVNGEVRNLTDKGKTCKEMHIPDYCNHIKIVNADWEKILHRNFVVERIWMSDYIVSFCSMGFTNAADAPRNLKEIALGRSVYDYGYLYGTFSLEKFSVHPKNSRFCVQDGVLYGNLFDAKALICYPPGKKEASFTVPADVCDIGFYAFAGTKNLEKVSLPKKLMRIYGCAFLDSGLTEISIPAKTGLSPDVFADCGRLQKVLLPNEVTSDVAFKNCPMLKTVVVPNTAKYIEGRCFQKCPSLTEFQMSPGESDFQVKDGVLLKKSTKELAAYPMGKRDAGYTVPRGIKIIGEGGFYGASHLREIKLDDGLIEIQGDAFVNCTSLKKLRIPKKVKKIYGYGDVGIFWGCTSLRAITVDSKNKYFTSSKGVLYSKKKRHLYCYPPAKKGKKYVVPKQVTRIKVSAVAKTRYLQKLVVGGHVRMIEQRAFMDGKALKTVVLSPKLDSISSSAFRNCKKLTKMVLPDRLGYVYGSICKNCTNLRELVLGKDVEDLYDLSFANCISLRKITFKGKKWLKLNNHRYPDNAPNAPFYQAGSKNYGKLTVYVPKCTKSQKKKCKKILWDNGLHKGAKIKFAK